jgi:DNA-binding response OmpR family regulator
MPAARRLLLIEDHAPLGRVLVEALSAAGYTVDLAIDGENGVDLFRTRRPDVVLLDLSLPRLPGTAVLAELRRLDPSVPVLVLSGDTSEAVVDRLRERGVVACLQKPISLEEIERRLSAVLSGAF